jgi:DNA-directed RNA polymerase subunit E'/Rpb7
MDKLNSDEEILRKLKERVEGRCHPDYGYLIQITKMPGTHSEQGIEISVPRVELNGCVVTVTFSAIAFKRKEWNMKLKKTM